MSDEAIPVESVDPVDAPAEHAEPTPEAPKPKEEPDLDRAFMGLKRKRGAAKREREEIENDKRALAAEREAMAKDLAVLKRLRAKDESLLKEEWGEDYFDIMTSRRLDPEGAAKDKAWQDKLDERDKKIDALIARLDGYEQERAAVVRQQEQRSLLEAAAKADHPELKILRDQDVISLADRLAVQIHKETGQYPTITSLLGLIAEEVRPEYERLKGHFGAPPPAAPKAEKKPAPKSPTTITAKDAATPAGTGATDVHRRDRLAPGLQEKLDKTG